MSLVGNLELITECTYKLLILGIIINHGLTLRFLEINVSETESRETYFDYSIAIIIKQLTWCIIRDYLQDQSTKITKIS